MPRTALAALLICALAVPCAEARPRDPIGKLFAGIGKAFSGQGVVTRRKKVVTRKTPKTAQVRHAKRKVVTHPTKVASVQYRAKVDKPARAIPEITVHPKEAPLANASGNVVLPDDKALRDIVGMYARANGIDPRVAVALIHVESRFDPWAVGSAGEIGLGQIKYQTAVDLGYSGTRKGLYHVGTNLRYAMRYLAVAKRKSDGTLCGTLSRYNAGIYSDARRPEYCRRVQAAMN